MRSLLLSFLAATCLAAADPPSSQEHSQQFVIGISPYLDRSVKDEVYRSMVRLLVEELPLGSTVSIYDAYELKSITHLELPQSRLISSAKARANQFAPAIRDVKQFLAREHPRPEQGRLDFKGVVRLPQFCDFLAENASSNDSPLSLLIIGSPLYQDPKEPGFSMVDGYFPSDGHLQATRDKSIFAASGGAILRSPLLMHWIFPSDPWLSDLHREEITRFWTLYLEGRGGQLVTFSGDFSTAMKRFTQGSLVAKSNPNRWTIDPQETKIEMLRVSRSVELSDWLTRENLPSTPAQPPGIMVGPMKIGIRWKENLDLDLYATPQRGAETLFFQHPQSNEGYYYKDHRSSPGREYEFIEFQSPVDVREVEASINFYKGSCPGGPGGEIRIEFDGRIYSAPFSITAEEGNQGRSGRSQADFWTKIPIQKTLKLNPTMNALR